MSKYKHTFTMKDMEEIYEATAELERQAIKVSQDLIYGMCHKSYGNKLFSAYADTLSEFNGKWRLYDPYSNPAIQC